MPSNRQLIENQKKKNGWILATEQLPENEQEVDVIYAAESCKTGETSYYAGRAFYTDGNHHIKDSNYLWNTNPGNYIEEVDSHLVPEGWWKRLSFKKEFFRIDGNVIAWRSLENLSKGKDSCCKRYFTAVKFRSLITEDYLDCAIYNEPYKIDENGYEFYARDDVKEWDTLEEALNYMKIMSNVWDDSDWGVFELENEKWKCIRR